MSCRHEVLLRLQILAAGACAGCAFARFGIVRMARGAGHAMDIGLARFVAVDGVHGGDIATAGVGAVCMALDAGVARIARMWIVTGHAAEAFVDASRRLIVAGTCHALRVR